jgi:tRNA1Val (adenine37-N6)-methyltransferase
VSSAALTSTDTLFDGAVHVVQPRRGYRFNVDSLWLAWFAASPARAAKVLDLGAGVGVVTLALAHFGRVARATLVERDPELAGLAAENLRRAGIDGAVTCADVLTAPGPQDPVDLVVANPPYFEPGARRAAAPEREPMRSGSLEPFVDAAARALPGPRARAAFVYPAPSVARLFRLAEERGLTAKRLRFVHGFAADPARVALVELRRAKPGGLVVEPPLVEWQYTGVPTPAHASLTLGRANGRT